MLGLIAEKLKDSGPVAQHDYAIDQAAKTLKAALQLNPAGREELQHVPELEHLASNVQNPNNAWLWLEHQD